MNLGVGAKIVWILILDTKEWWKQDFLKKHYHKDRLLRSTKASWIGKGSTKYGIYVRQPPQL